MSSLKLTPVFAALLFSTCVLCFGITHEMEASGHMDVKDDPLFQILGSAKEALGDVVYMQADSYLHGGLRSDLLDLQRHRQNGELGTDTEKNKEIQSLLSHDWVGQVYSQVNVVEHRHMESKKSQEMLPLLDISTRLDPHNVAAVLTAAYWFKDRFQDSDKALEILTRGFEENPDSWEIEFELGQVFFEAKKDNRAAIEHFLSAVKKLDLGEHSWFDPVRIRYALAEAYYKEKDYPKALSSYKETLNLYPSNQKSALRGVIQKRITELESALVKEEECNGVEFNFPKGN